MSFPWQPWFLAARAGCLRQLRRWLPADFDFARPGRLPGLSGADVACPGENFAARILWRPGGGGAGIRA
jgi:hypothetical protein